MTSQILWWFYRRWFIRGEVWQCFGKLVCGKPPDAEFIKKWNPLKKFLAGPAIKRGLDFLYPFEIIWGWIMSGTFFPSPDIFQVWKFPSSASLYSGVCRVKRQPLTQNVNMLTFFSHFFNIFYIFIKKHSKSPIKSLYKTKRPPTTSEDP